MNATGRPSCDKMALIAVLEASVVRQRGLSESTIRNTASLIDCFTCCIASMASFAQR